MLNYKYKLNSFKAFTFLEVMVVIALLGVVASMVVFNLYSPKNLDAELKKFKIEINELKKDAFWKRIDYGIVLHKKGLSLWQRSFNRDWKLKKSNIFINTKYSIKVFVLPSKSNDYYEENENINKKSNTILSLKAYKESAKANKLIPPIIIYKNNSLSNFELVICEKNNDKKCMNFLSTDLLGKEINYSKEIYNVS